MAVLLHKKGPQCSLSLSLAPAKPPIPPFSPGREPVTRNADETHPTNLLGRSQTHLTLHTLDRALPDLNSLNARSPSTLTPSGEEIRPCLWAVGMAGSVVAVIKKGVNTLGKRKQRYRFLAL